MSRSHARAPLLMRSIEPDPRNLFDPEIERLILGTLLADGNDAFDQVCKILTPDHFSLEPHRKIWATAERLARAGVAIGSDSIAHSLIEQDALDSVNGLTGLLDLHSCGIHNLQLPGFARSLADKGRRRRQLKLAGLIQKNIECGQEPSRNALDELATLSGQAINPTTDIADLRPVAEYAGAGVRYVYPGLFAEATVNVLSGDPGCGKSTLASYIADCVSEHRKVLLLDRENSAPIVAERHARMGIRDGGSFRVWGGWCEREAPGPDSPELNAWVEANDPKPLLIFDSLVAFAGGVEENDAGQVRAFMQHFRRLADMGACVVVLHHSGKGENTKDYRGSSDIKAAIDSGWHLSNFGDGQLGRLRLRPWKCRYGIAHELVLNYRDGEFSTETTQSVTRTVSELLAELLRANPGVRAADFEAMARDKGLGRDRARKFLEEGFDSGKVERFKGVNNTKHYSLKGEE
jgi:hypothetical protein